MLMVNGLLQEKSILWNQEEMALIMLQEETMYLDLLYTGDPGINIMSMKKLMLNILTENP
jgi:hypothetical protein